MKVRLDVKVRKSGVHFPSHQAIYPGDRFFDA